MSEKKTTTKTFKELGNNLPLGVVGKDNNLHKSISFRPWRMKEEKELGKLREEYSSASVGRYVAIVLATMCEKIGPFDFSEMKLEEKLLTISQMYMGDVFAAYCQLRIATMGNVLGMSINCPRCKNTFDFDGDLNTLDVTTTETPENMEWEYVLKHPFEIRGKKVTGFKLGLPFWSVVENATDKNDGSASVKDALIRGAVREIKGDKNINVLTSDDLEEMTKIDIESLVKKIEDNALGPVMVLEAKCDKCKADIIKTIDWTYDGFFGDSSR